MTAHLTEMSAIISDCAMFRYRLERQVSAIGPVALIIGVNPSTADASVNDATIRKDIGFAKRHGWGRILKGNLFAYRATDVRKLATAVDPRGPECDEHLAHMMSDADVIVAAWGPTAKLPKPLRNRWRDIAAMSDTVGKTLHCFGVAQDGQPRHTLMLAYDTPLIPWVRP